MFPTGTKIRINYKNATIKAQYRCKQCKKPMNPVDALINPVCLECCKKNHKALIK